MRKDLLGAVRRNREREKSATVFSMEEAQGGDTWGSNKTNPMDLIVGNYYNCSPWSSLKEEIHGVVIRLILWT